MQRDIIHTDAAPRAIGPYVQAVKTGRTVYLSGQVGLNPATQAMAGEDLAAQARQVFQNISAVAQAAGASLAHVIRLTLYLTDMSAFAQVNELMQEFFSEPYPARVAIGVAALPKGALFEADAILALD
jgi:reactive intermediate/imine deaminase